jgi:hypothetical protein
MSGFSRRKVIGGAAVGSLLATAAAASRPFTQTQQPPFGPAPDPLSGAGLPLGYVTPQQFGAKGDGVNDDTAALQAAINAAFVQVLANQTPSPTGNKILYFPPGKYNVSGDPALTINGMFGAIMMGAGMLTTEIAATDGGDVIATNGCAYSKFKDIKFTTSGAGTCFNLDWDGVTYCSLHQNVFDHVFFNGGAYGIRIGAGGYMGSENLFLSSQASNQSVAGLATFNANALNQTIIGGGYGGNNAIGILVYGGSVGFIGDVAFALSSTDISIQWSSNTIICGCRTESVNFLASGRGAHVVSGCVQDCVTPGLFISSAQYDPITIEGCASIAGQLDIRGGGTVNNVTIARDDWFSSGSIFRFSNVMVGKTSDGQGTGTARKYSNGCVGVIGGTGSLFLTDTGAGALTDAPIITTDPLANAERTGSANTFGVTINGNRTLANPAIVVPETSELTRGMIYTWMITQGAGGNHTLAYGNMFTFPGGTPPTLSTAAGAVDVLTAVYDGAKLRAQLTKAYA